MVEKNQGKKGKERKKKERKGKISSIID